MSIAPVHVPTPVHSRPAPSLLPAARPRRHLQSVSLDQSSLAVDFRSGRHDVEFGPQHSSTGDLPDPTAWGTRLVHGLLEVMSGVRPPSQIERCLTLELRERVRRAYATAVRRGARPGRPSRVLRVRVCDAVDGIAEVSAVVYDRGRVRAVAMRLSGCDGRWLLTELEMG